ncbi:MAG: hypothetical protein R3F65_08205 [bacterium]
MPQSVVEPRAVVVRGPERESGETMCPRLLVLLVICLLSGLADARDPGACATDVARGGDAAPVYVVLFGYPHAPGTGLPSLQLVDEDLLHMATFFEALGPAALWVHGEPEPGLLQRFGAEGLRAPTWRALRATIDDLRRRLARGGRPARVYLYFAGHGIKGRSFEADGLSARLFARPEPGTAERGYNGVIDGALVAREVLQPLSVHADVNLIADACNSFYLLTARGPSQGERVRKKPPELPIADPFAHLFPAVGATLATDGITYEDSTIGGGLFSHALRSAGIGPADLDQDGIITYGEFHFVLNWILATTPFGARPTVVPPGLQRDATFIDWRGSAAARVCLPSSLTGRQLITTRDGLAATLHLRSTRPFPIWLDPGRRYGLVGKEHQVAFIASDGPLTPLESGAAAMGRGVPWPAVFAEPIDVEQWRPLPPVPPASAGWYYGVGGVAAVGYAPAAGGGAEGWAPAADLGARLGRGVHRLVAEAGWTRWGVGGAAVETERGAFRGPERQAHMVSGRAGYDHLLVEGGWELAVGGLLGVAARFGAETAPAPLPEGTLRASALVPLAAKRWSLRFDGRVVVVPAEEGAGTLVRVGVGMDFEDGFE